MVTVLPVSAGFGVTDTALIVGGVVLIFTAIVCSVDLPALSVAVTLIVLVPTIPVISFENVPFSPIVIAPTDVPLSVAVIVTGDDVTNGKPHPEPFLTAAKRLGVSPNDCFVFEDSSNGIISGYRAGMRCIGVADIAPFSDEAKKMIFREYNSLDEAIPYLKSCL